MYRAAFIDCNQKRYSYLRSKRFEIEQQFQGKLQWPTVGGKTASITAQVSQYGLDDFEKWGEIQNDMIEGMKELIRILAPYVKAMPP